jgi:tape measure domain-containing protein
MAGQIISTYEAKFGFQLDTASVKTVYKQIDTLKATIDKKLSSALKIDKIILNQGSLNAVKNKIQKSLGTSVQINRITLSPQASNGLRSALRNSLVSASTNLALPINSFNINVAALRSQVQAAFNTGIPLRINPVNGGGGSGQRTGRYSSISQSSLGYGLLGGMNEVVPAFAATFGAMRLNSISEDLQSGQMALGTVTRGRGQEAFDWLRSTGREIGIDYRSQLPVFSNYVASSINKQGYDGSLESFKDISLFGMTHGATNQSMEKAMLALGQMWSKGKVNAEELNTQLAEARGFGGVKELFAQAYQEKTGGGLLGQKAEAALIKAMKDGKVLSADILPIVTRLMRERAAGGISAYQQTTQFSRNNMKNAFSDAVLAFGRGGFDRGMARVFQSIAESIDGMVKSGTIDKLGRGFNLISIALDGIVDSSTKVINFFMELGGAFAIVAPLAAGLFKIIGVKGSIFGAMLLAFDDLSAYIDGRDSLLGQFIGYMNDLTGMDWNAISAGLGVVGIGILAAFSPITALAASIGALIAAFKYLEELKAKEKPINPNSASLPTSDQMTANSLRMAGEAWDKDKSWSTGFHLAATNVDAIAAGIGIRTNEKVWSIAGQDSRKPYSALVDRLEAAKQAGWLSSDEFSRSTAALGSGMSNPAAIESWLNTRQNSGPNSQPFYQQEQPIFNFNGDINLPNVKDPVDFMQQISERVISNHQTGEGVKAKPSTP